MPTNAQNLDTILASCNTVYSNEVALDTTNFIFDLPCVNHDVIISKNTKLNARPIEANPLKSKVAVYYDRVDLTARLEAFSVSKGNATTMASVVNQLNTLYGLDLGAEDYIDAPLGAVGGSDALRAHDNSYKYKGVLFFNIIA
jgi:hypothetical protein